MQKCQQITNIRDMTCERNNVGETDVIRMHFNPTTGIDVKNYTLIG